MRATSFSGYYLALWLVLWSFMLRGLAIEVAGHMSDPLWQGFWDFAFAVANVLLAVLFGAALGNVIRGVPIDQTGRFSLALFTDFGVRGQVGILDWYTLSTAVQTLLLLSAHGATYLALKTNGDVHTQSGLAARWLWRAVAVGFPVVTFETWIVRPEMFAGILQRPLGWLALAIIVGGAVLLVIGRWRRLESHAFAGSCALITGLLAALGVGVFPVMLRSTIAPQFSLTAYQAASNTHSLGLALLWWPVAFILALIYFAFIARQFRGKVRPSETNQGYY